MYSVDSTENPAISQNSPEYQTIKEFNDYLVSELRVNLITMCKALLQASLILQAVTEQVGEMIRIQSRQKALTLSHVSDCVQTDPQKFCKFCKVLDELQHEELAKMLREHCKKLKQQ